MPDKLTDIHSVISVLQSMESSENRLGMARFGIKVEDALGIKVADLRRLALRIEKNHDLALKLWDTGIHEARLLATMVDDPTAVTERQMENWATDFDSWDVVDQACNNLFRKTVFAHRKAAEWTSREAEFVKRAGFTLVAVLAVHDRAADNSVFEAYLDLVEKASGDERNYVKKAVNWSLRQIGKRNKALFGRAMSTIHRISGTDSRSGRWIASDAGRELRRVGNERGWG